MNSFARILLMISKGASERCRCCGLTTCKHPPIHSCPAADPAPEIREIYISTCPPLVATAAAARLIAPVPPAPQLLRNIRRKTAGEKADGGGGGGGGGGRGGGRSSGSFCAPGGGADGGRLEELLSAVRSRPRERAHGPAQRPSGRFRDVSGRGKDSRVPARRIPWTRRAVMRRPGRSARGAGRREPMGGLRRARRANGRGNPPPRRAARHSAPPRRDRSAAGAHARVRASACALAAGPRLRRACARLHGAARAGAHVHSYACTRACPRP